MLHKLAKWFRLCIEDTSKVFNPYSFGLVTAGTVYHMGYAYGSKSNEDIEIASKYQIFGADGTHFAVNTTDGRQFLVPSSLWYWQFDVPEKWNTMSVGKNII